jgi:hypothetical protein
VAGPIRSCEMKHISARCSAVCDARWPFLVLRTDCGRRTGPIGLRRTSPARTPMAAPEAAPIITSSSLNHATCDACLSLFSSFVLAMCVPGRVPTTLAGRVLYQAGQNFDSEHQKFSDLVTSRLKWRVRSRSTRRSGSFSSNVGTQREQSLAI